MLFLPADVYALVEKSVPIACVDFVPVRDGADGIEVGLIFRESPFGRVWCHLGGRIGRDESIRGALQRHADDTLGVTLALPADPQPTHVYQWFAPGGEPADAADIPHGDDTRKHAIGLSFLTSIEAGLPSARNEAIEFAWFDPQELPQPLWPGCAQLLEVLL